MAVALFYVLVHHSIAGVIAPESVFNHPAAIANPFLWAGIHASYVMMLMAVILAYWRFSENLEGALAREEGTSNLCGGGKASRRTRTARIIGPLEGRVRGFGQS
ncbi:MAG TPA: hypothetical protein VM848_11275 [Acidimicrobiia bacterium]|nr:hypothetical protein [Acidimicrobiia bacterium]